MPSTRDSVSTRRPPSQATNPTGRLTKNAQRHPPAEMRTAPSDGPVATARAPTPPHSATICERRSAGKAPSSNPTEDGTMAAAPLPCTTRPAISQATEGAKAQRAEPTVNTASPPKKIRRRPSLSAVRPAVTRSDANTMV